MQGLQKLSQIAYDYLDHLTGAKLPHLYYDPHGVFQNIVPHLDSLQQKYRPTPWLSNPHAQVLYFDLIKSKRLNVAYDEVEQLEMPDGGITGIAWYGKNLSPETPTIVLMHTLTGNTTSMCELVQDLHYYTGWRIALCLRRGHANLPLPVPKINLLGCTDDLRSQIEHIQQLYPQSDLYAVGSSAGTGLLVRYLGEEGTQTPFKAAFALSPGYNSETGFEFVSPFYSKLMTKKVFKCFIEHYQDTWQDQTQLDGLIQAKTLAEFERNYFKLAGFADYKSYAQAVNPIYVLPDIKIPLIVLNAEDDPICTIRNLAPYKDQLSKMPNVLVVTTSKGSHCIFYQGFAKTESWSTRLMADYFRHYAQELAC